MSNLINRREAIKQFCNQCKGRNEPCEHRQSCETMKVLKSLPSAEPKTGRWVKHDSVYHTAICSECEKVTMFEVWGGEEKPYDYCPNCGADMRGEEE